MSAPAPEPLLSRKGVLLATLGAALAAALIVFAAILPAEFGADPTGLGRIAGLSRLWAPKEIEVSATEGAAPLQRDYPAGWRTDIIEIPLTSGDDLETRRYELEYKVSMKKGATLIYEWDVAGNDIPELFYSEFHGHDLPPPGQEMSVVNYKKATGLRQQGALVAPFDGIHGWYLQNQALPPVVVRMRIAGFYELIAPGQPGNEAGILAGKPAAKSRPN
jgi:hypothetical protein